VVGQIAATLEVAIQSASWRLASATPRARRRVAAVAATLCLATAVLTGYFLSVWTGAGAPSAAEPLPTIRPGVHLQDVYKMDAGNGSSSYAFLPNDSATQEFHSFEPYIDRAAVIVGIDQTTERSTTHTLEIQILDSNGKILGDQFASLVNNGYTTVVFPDIPTSPGAVYRLRAWNRSEDALGIYLNAPSAESNNIGPATIEGQPPETGVICGYVEGRNMPTTHPLRAG
jgi:hypothetical protein